MTLNEIKKSIGIEPYYEEDAGIIYNMDCMDVLPRIPEKSIDLVLTDPPYGIEICRKSNCYGVSTINSREATSMDWDDKPISWQQVEQIYMVSANQIIFGGNFFIEHLFGSRCWIIWDKRGNLPDVPFSPVELAWTSFTGKMPKIYTCINHGFISEDKTPKLHPTMKPLKLISNIIKDFSESTDLILDPFLGSGTTALAAKQLGRKYIGIEISEKYVNIAVQRLSQGILL